MRPEELKEGSRNSEGALVSVRSTEELDFLAKEAQMVGNRPTCAFIGAFDDALVRFEVAAVPNGYEVAARAGSGCAAVTFVANGDLETHSLGHLISRGRLFALRR